MGDICCNIFAYADDLAILSPTCNALKKMMTICEQYALKFSLSFNPDKCVSIIFSDSEYYMNNVSIKMYGRNIQNFRSEKHLGHIISARGSLINIEPVSKYMKVRTILYFFFFFFFFFFTFRPMAPVGFS